MFNSAPVTENLAENFGDLLDRFDQETSVTLGKVGIWLLAAAAGWGAAIAAGLTLAQAI